MTNLLLDVSRRCSGLKSKCLVCTKGYRRALASPYPLFELSKDGATPALLLFQVRCSEASVPRTAY